MQYFVKQAFLFAEFLCFLGLFSLLSVARSQTPTNPQAISITHNDAFLQWDDNSETSLWIVALKLQHSPETTYFYCDSSHLALHNLLARSTYFWKVCAVSENNDTSVYTPSQWFQTDRDYAENFRCTPPSGLSIMDIEHGNATIQWIPSHSSDTLWELVYGPVSNNTLETGNAEPITNTAFQTLHNIAPHTYYQACIRNVCADTVSEWTTIFFKASDQQPRTLPILCDFEGETDLNHFSFVSGSDNPWVIDSSVNYSFAGAKSLYVSTDDGEHALYSRKRKACSYAFTNIDIPYDAESFYLDFRWKGSAIGDSMQIYLLPRNAELDIMNNPDENYRIGRVSYNNSNNQWQNERIELDSIFVGYEKKLVFMWKNREATGISGTSTAIDELYITARYCARPNKPIVSNITAESAVLNWAPVTDQQFFNIQYRKNTDSEWSSRHQVVSGYVLDSLQDGVTYHVRTQTVCTTSEESLWSDVASFTTNTRCLPPSQPVVSNIYSTEMTIRWTDSVSIRWVVQYQESGSSSPFLTDTVYQPFDTLRNLQPNTSYKIIVRGICASMDLSYPSPALSATTACLPSTVLPWTSFEDTLNLSSDTEISDIPNCWSLQGNSLISPILDLSLAGNLSLSYSFAIQSTDESSSGGAWVKVTKDNGNSWQSFDVLTFPADFTTRQFDFSAYAGFPSVRIKIEYTLDQNVSLKIHRLRLNEECMPPTGITVTHLTDTSATFDWIPAANQTAWKLLYKKQSETAFRQLHVTEHPYVLKNLSAETCYDYKVIAICDNETSDTSSLLHFCTPPSVPEDTCVLPSNIAVEVIYASNGNSNIAFSWEPVEDQHRWQVEYKDSSEFFTHLEDISFSTHFALRNANLYRTYLFRIRTFCDSSSFSEWSDWYSIVVLPNSLNEVAEGIECKVFPNPTNGKFFMELQGSNLRKISVYSLHGMLVTTFAPSETFQLANLPPQTYYLLIETDKGIVSRKIILGN